jgi:hypothetical protein
MLPRARCRRSLETIRNWLASQDIFLAGRYSEWEYYNSDHAFIAGKRAAEIVRGLLIAAANRVDITSPALAPSLRFVQPIEGKDDA